MLSSAVITKPKRSVFAVLDVGSSKIVCFIIKAALGSFKVLGVGYRSSEGFEGGSISDIRKASQSILSTVDAAEQVAEESVDQVYVNISGCGITSHAVFNEINSTQHEIGERDVRRVISQSYEKFSDSNVVVHNIPIKYWVDSTGVVNDPCGLYGSRIGVDMHVVTASRSSLVNLEHCIVGCHLDLAGCIVSSYSSGISCLTEDEKDLGVAIIDIGGMYTSLGLFHRGSFIYADTVPIGGLSITRDITYGLCIGISEAEKIKIKYGSAVSIHSNCNFSIDLSAECVDSDQTYIQISDLTSIIRPRVEEILYLSKDKLENMGGLFRKVVITGGGSQMEGLKELSSSIFGRQVKLGMPLDIVDIDPTYKRNPIFSSVIGAASFISSSFFKEGDDLGEKKHSIISKVIDTIGLNKLFKD